MPDILYKKCLLCAVCLTITALFLYVTETTAAPTDSRFLWLVNAENPLPASFAPSPLTTHNHVRLHTAARDAFILLSKSMQKDGIYGLHLHSAYRDYARQKNLFQQKVRHYKSQGFPSQEAETYAAQCVHHPGKSEHQTGLALDVSTTSQLNQSFGETQAGRWLSKNAHLFGFIIRYPKEKTHTTHTIYEPWHLRYVGFPHAAVMYEYDLTLEEYIDFLQTHPVFIYTSNENKRYLIQFTHGLPYPLPQNILDISSTAYHPTPNYVTVSPLSHPLYTTCNFPR
jgi:D-alanyl-D-alanine carboxypeptidase